jgi:hypothetical protein
MENLSLNIVGTIKRTKIKGLKNSTAKFAKLNPTEKFIEKFYKFNEIGLLVYLSESSNDFFYSEYNQNGKDSNKLKNCKFLEIID